MYFSLLNTSLKMAEKRPKHVAGLPHVCIPEYYFLSGNWREPMYGYHAL
jgi:hypothetical protein